jgi:hypothetical protein
MDEPVVKKITALIRLLSSPKDHEAVASLHALLRCLASNKLDIHVVADRFERGGDDPLSAAEMQRLYDKGFIDGSEHGRRAAVLAAQPSRPWHEVAASVDDGVNGYSWLQIAQHCLTNKHLFRDRDAEFIESVAEQLTYRDPSQPQAKWLRDLFMRKLGGRIE